MSKILVADDDEEILEMLKTGLESQGHKVTIAANGKTALTLIKYERPDLLILDVMMPDIDGYTIEIELSEDEKTNKIPIIVLSALAPSKTLFKNYPQVVYFMNKPLDFDKLCARINKTLNLKVKS